MWAETDDAMLLRDAGNSLHYFFPIEEVNMDLLIPTDHTTHSGWRGDTRHWTVKVGDRVAENAAWTYDTIPEDRPNTNGYITFDWNAMDAWYEEDEEVFVHPRDPFTRVDAIRSSRYVRIENDGVTVADTTRPVLLFETGLPTRYYIPAEDVRMELLTATDLHTSCPYKGTASYWSVEVNDSVHENIVWSYPNPIPEMPKIKGLLAFFNEKLDIYVDGVLQERPRTYWS
jgi:uncharacterized protein (DUF427 family)